MSKEVRRTIELSIDPVKDFDVSVVDYKNLDFDMEFVFDKFIKGDKGDKPIRGVDYWTSSDVQEFKDYCVDVITQQWFGTEAQYDYMVAHGMIQDDWIYFIYEDQGQQQPSYIDGDTLVINGAVLIDDNTTVQVYGYLENENTTLVLDNQI